MTKPGLPPIERFWLYVDRSDGCWTWTGMTNGVYGCFKKSPDEKVYAHVYAYELAYGPVPEGKEVCHHCDNPVCIRFSHLFSGTRSDNMKDCVAKGRHGSQRPLEIRVKDRRKGQHLSDLEVEQIRDLHKRGEYSQAKLAEIFKVTPRAICKVINKESHATTEAA